MPEREREREMYFSDIVCKEIYSDGTTRYTQKVTRYWVSYKLTSLLVGYLFIQQFLHVYNWRI